MTFDMMYFCGISWGVQYMYFFSCVKQRLSYNPSFFSLSNPSFSGTGMRTFSRLVLQSVLLATFSVPALFIKNFQLFGTPYMTVHSEIIHFRLKPGFPVIMIFDKSSNSLKSIYCQTYPDIREQVGQRTFIASRDLPASILLGYFTVSCEKKIYFSL